MSASGASRACGEEPFGGREAEGNYRSGGIARFRIRLGVGRWPAIGRGCLPPASSTRGGRLARAPRALQVPRCAGTVTEDEHRKGSSSERVDGAQGVAGGHGFASQAAQAAPIKTRQYRAESGPKGRRRGKEGSGNGQGALRLVGGSGRSTCRKVYRERYPDGYEAVKARI